MKYIVMSLLVLALTGCGSTITVKREFPKPPADLMKPPLKLVPLVPGT